MLNRIQAGKRRFLTAFLAVVLACLSCLSFAGPTRAEAAIGKAVILDQDQVTAYPETSQQINMYVGGTVAQAEKWTSSDKSVATVSKKGLVTAKKAGKATITCKTGFGYNLKCKVTVKKRVEISGLLNKNYKQLLKKEPDASFTTNDPLALNNLYIYPDASLFMRFDLKTKKPEAVQNTYSDRLSIYGIYRQMKLKKATALLKKKGWKLVTKQASGSGYLRTYKRKGHKLLVWSENSKVRGYQWIR